MWKNYFDEPFILPPKHAALFSIAAACLSDNVGWHPQEGDDDHMGIAAFDRLTTGQKQTAILEVSRALLRAEVEPPRVTAALAAIVDAIYCELLTLIEFEMAREGDTTMRALLLAAMAEANYWEDVNSACGPGEEPEVPAAQDCTEFDVWEVLVEALRTTILEDDDFDMEDKFLDLPPDQADLLKRSLNIDHDYFTANPDNPPPSQWKALGNELRTILAAAYR